MYIWMNNEKKCKHMQNMPQLISMSMVHPCGSSDKLEMAEDTDLFRQHFKYLKSRKPCPDLSSVIDFEGKLTNNEHKEGSKCVNVISQCLLQEPEVPLPLGLKPVSQWKAYHLSQHPGFVVIINPFVAGYQRYWIKQCMEVYHLPPNVTNLDAHFDRSQTIHIYDDFVKNNREELQKDDLLMKLRWATLGYHYDWTAKKYYAEKYSEFPWDLSMLSSCIAEATGYRSFRAEAGIVNYYHMDSTLAGHTDHSEFDLEAPLMSLSFGQDAVFLLGGKTKAEPPTAMYLRSGDICVMGGESRMAYHAVPRILPATSPAYMQGLEQGEITLTQSDRQCECLSKCSHKLSRYIRDEMANINWKPLDVFLKTSRINVNIRQVLKAGQPFQTDCGDQNSSEQSNYCETEEAPTKKCKLDF